MPAPDYPYAVTFYNPRFTRDTVIGRGASIEDAATDALKNRGAKPVLSAQPAAGQAAHYELSQNSRGAYLMRSLGWPKLEAVGEIYDKAEAQKIMQALNGQAEGKHLVASLVKAWESGDLAHAVNQLRDWAGIAP